ncbi:MAG: hypothetical protein PHQ39_12115 [Methanothrix soehngenii]|jgi:hypothetical protein|nr:hypothetical protein [Methanothrix soehngenii]
MQRGDLLVIQVYLFPELGYLILQRLDGLLERRRKVKERLSGLFSEDEQRGSSGAGQGSKERGLKALLHYPF